MTTFTLRQQHLDLLAKAETASSVNGISERTIRLPSRLIIARKLKMNDNDAMGVQWELGTALEIILSARGEAVPLGRYRKNDGRWELEP